MCTQVCKDFFKTYFYNNRTLSLLDKETFMDKPFTILPDAPAMPGAKASPFYVQKEKKGEQKSYRTITHWHDELECLTILDGTLDFQLNESVISRRRVRR